MQVDPDEIRRRADEILSDPAYREPSPSVVERVFDAAGDALGRLFETLTGGGPGSVIGLVVIGALVAGAVWLVTRSVGGPVPGRVVHGPAVTHGTTAPIDAGEWLREAERLLAAGDRRGALRCRYQALVSDLIAMRVLDDVPGRTPSELRDALVAGRPLLEPVADRVTATFEEVWYGHVDPDAARYADFASDLEQLAATVREAVPA